jgi:hypothetical protein
MNLPKLLTVACLLVLAQAGAAQAAPRQFYDKSWQKKGGYYYREYYYKPTPTAATYRYHTVIYYPAKPKYYYYYNPYKERYWGRFDRTCDGYSKLADDDQKGKISDIVESAFPQPGQMPDIPESSDGVKMEPPPPGLPPDESAELAQEQMRILLVQAPGKETPRQAYSAWCKQGGYYFCCYYYQPAADGPYKSQRCIYYPARPNYVYYYNPTKKLYWGRYDMNAKGYSLLAEKDRAEKLTGIDEKAFPKPGAMPPVPETKEDAKVLPPPAVPQ